MIAGSGIHRSDPLKQRSIVPLSSPPISLAIPTFRRERVLIETIDSVLALAIAPAEILVVDQTPRHETETETSLAALERADRIRWIRLDAPSIPHAMNRALLAAKYDVVLFLDDDVIPSPHLIEEHARIHRLESPDLVAGRVIQPWDVEDEGPDGEVTAGLVPAEDFMGGNFSVVRTRALELGGFDENFVRVAYRYEAEFAARLRATGGRLLYSHAAYLRHLKADDGGTRTYGLHYRTLRPDHAVGEYYFLLRAHGVRSRLLRLLKRPVRAVSSRFHFRHPWWIPLTFLSELTGLFWAVSLALKGPKHVSRPAAR